MEEIMEFPHEHEVVQEFEVIGPVTYPKTHGLFPGVHLLPFIEIKDRDGFDQLSPLALYNILDACTLCLPMQDKGDISVDGREFCKGLKTHGPGHTLENLHYIQFKEECTFRFQIRCLKDLPGERPHKTQGRS